MRLAVGGSGSAVSNTLSYMSCKVGASKQELCGSDIPFFCGAPPVPLTARTIREFCIGARQVCGMDEDNYRFIINDLCMN